MLQILRSSFLYSILLCFSLHATAPSNTLIQTQLKLKKLDAQIRNLQHTIATAHDKHLVLEQELSKTEKQIGEGVQKLHSIQYAMRTNETKISQLQKDIIQLNQKVDNQNTLLIHHVRARYQMGEYQPLKWVINQDDPYQLSRILTYYQYMIKSRQQLIDEMNETHKRLDDNKKKLHAELGQYQLSKESLVHHQEAMEENKRYNTLLIRTLNHDIQNQQQRLGNAQKNKDNLSALIQSLSQTSPVISKPFNQMRRKLPFPVHTAHRSILRMNQGVTFFADEGTVVTAVYPGKVVFSDWLKGYGLLIIIDHGKGFMTLYAHNQSLFKRKGDIVNQNEQIASIGHTGGIRQNGLYFEIRVRGKAVPPLSWFG